jgi:hypothetical protein
VIAIVMQANASFLRMKQLSGLASFGLNPKANKALPNAALWHNPPRDK